MLRVSLDKKGRPRDIERVDIADADGARLAQGTGLEADVDDFFEDLDRALDHLLDGDLDGAPHHLADLYDTAPIRFVGARRADRILGAEGQNAIKARGGDDVVLGSLGKDKVNGGKGDDGIYYGAVEVKPRQTGVSADLEKHKAVIDGDRQTIRRFEALGGTRGQDKLAGDDRGNVLSGGEGNDTLEGGGGTDALTGGAGEDEFRLSSESGADLATDFEVGTDRIRANVGFPDLTFADVEGGTQIRTSGGDLVGTIAGVDAATLDGAAHFL
ncbi:hypothetical protein [uncultured Albimonas sp.]|uniref:hypothetical protein n=1 Tax=uncultured Albimonas sp. TaxID=1331701 RepID=UPI0030EE4DA5